MVINIKKNPLKNPQKTKTKTTLNVRLLSDLTTNTSSSVI